MFNKIFHWCSHNKHLTLSWRSWEHFKNIFVFGEPTVFIIICICIHYGSPLAAATLWMHSVVQLARYPPVLSGSSRIKAIISFWKHYKYTQHIFQHINVPTVFQQPNYIFYIYIYLYLFFFYLNMRPAYI